MKTISSAEFRKTYPRLTEVTLVTVNGHDLGWWNPFNAEPPPVKPHVTAPSQPMAQAERDAILRKINKGT